LVFEDNSKLATLGDFAFDVCSSLQSICIPASLHHVSGWTLAGSGILIVTVNPGNQFFRVSGNFFGEPGCPLPVFRQ
jgi:hypothetical protein